MAGAIMPKFISDEEMMKLENQKGFLSDEQMAALESSGPSALEAGIQGAFEGASLGWRDELAGALEAGGQFLGVKGLGGKFSDIGLQDSISADQLGKVYEETKQRRESELSKYKEAQPEAFLAGNVAGGLASSFAVPNPATFGGRIALGAGTGAVAGAGQAEEGKALQGAALGGLIGGAVVPAAEGVGKLLKTGAQKLSPKLADIAETMKIKSTGATGKELQGFRPGTGRYMLENKIGGAFSSPSDIAEQAAQKMSSAGSQMGNILDELSPKDSPILHNKVDSDDFYNTIQKVISNEDPLYKANITPYSKQDYSEFQTFLSPDKKSGYAIKPNGELISVFSLEKGRGGGLVTDAVLNKGASKLDAFDINNKLPSLYGKYMDETNRLKFADEFAPSDWNYEKLGRPDVVEMALSPEKVAQNQSKFILTDDIINDLTTRRNELAQSYAQEPVVEQLDKIINNIKSSNRKILSTSQAQKMKVDFDTKIKNWADPNASMANKEARDVFKVATERFAEQSSPEIATAFKSAKQDYGMLAPVEAAASRRAATLQQSPMGGLLDVATANAGSIGGLPGMAASAASRRVFAPRAASMAAHTTDMVSKLLKTAPEKLGKYIPIINNAASRGPHSVAITDYLLSQQDPEYREMKRQLDENR
jgi:hypothetical protein